jgi:CheY-like chemotaxis protein
MNMAAKHRVLVVEDDDESAEKYVDWLTADGHDVARATDAQEARLRAADFHPDVVVLDLQIPSAKSNLDENVEHGLGVLRDFVAEEPFRPIVIATAHSKDRELTRSVLQVTRGGGFLFKDEPNLKNALIKAVATALASPAFVANKKVQAFEAIVDKPRNTQTWENDINSELSTNWRAIIGPQYLKCHPKYTLYNDMKVDLLFERPDGYVDIWELKLPTDRIFEHYNQRKHLSKDCATGMGQLIEYIDRAEKTLPDPLSFAARRGVGAFVHRARGVLVIGRDGDTSERDRLALENSFYAGIRIMTYDDLLRGARDLLQYLREHRNGFHDS